MIRGQSRLRHRRTAISSCSRARRSGVVGYLGCLAQAGADDPQEWEEAYLQCARLWRLAVPALLDNLDNKNLAVAGEAANLLILMRDEAIIKAIIEKALAAKDAEKRALFVFPLVGMKTLRPTVLPDRKGLDQKQSEELYDRLVKPALDKLGVKPPA